MIRAAPGFRLVATMNPGGDYGKKELSPALSNRLTQIWVPAIEDESELGAIIQSRITGETHCTNAGVLLSTSMLSLRSVLCSAIIQPRTTGLVTVSAPVLLSTWELSGRSILSSVKQHPLGSACS